MSDLFPEDFVDVPCDACDFWDDRSICLPTDPDPLPPPDVNPVFDLIRLCGRGTGQAVAMLLPGLVVMGLVRRRW